MTPRYRPFGDAALIVEFGETVDRALAEAVLALDRAVAERPPPGLIETAPSFRSLLVRFEPLETDAAAVEAALRALAPRPQAAAGRLWRLPCCYDPELGLDLEETAERAGLSPEAAARRHAEAEHFAFMIGFLPGAPYLGGLPQELDAPRRRDPRTRVPAGSVAIAVGLTTIYPVESPGGWHVLGRTPAPLFDPGRDPPALLAPGDRVRFEPVSRAEYDRLAVEPVWPAPVSPEAAT
jgi:KipI family sensor histidine kinase inhibitor